MAFIKRNIALGSTIGEIYRKDRWEYPLEAIREAIINAIVHRDYSILGSDIKVAIFDDMIEVTSPGVFLPAINPEDIGSNPSEIRNRTLAPIFKKLGLIEQWGSGFKKILAELKEYTELELNITEPSLNVQIQFIKKNYMPESTQEVLGEKLGEKLGKNRKYILKLMKENSRITIGELSKRMHISTTAVENNIDFLKKHNYIKRVGPAKGGYWEVFAGTEGNTD